jgi:hypothetical protein
LQNLGLHYWNELKSKVTVSSKHLELVLPVRDIIGVQEVLLAVQYLVRLLSIISVILIE